MSNLERTIILDADVADALKKLGAVFSSLDSLGDKADETNSKISEGTKKSANHFESFTKGVEKTVGLLGALGAAGTVAIASMAYGMRELNAGLVSFGEGAKSSMVKSAGGLSIASSELSNLTNGFLSVQEASEFIRKGRGIGMTPEQLNTVAKMATNISLVSSEFDTASAAAKIMDSLVRGTVGKLDDMDSALAQAIGTNKEYLAAKTMEQKQQAILNVIVANYGKTLERNGDIAATSMARMLGLQKQIHAGFMGLGQMAEGLGKTVLGISAPFLAMAGAGAGIGGLLGGPLGALAGGTAGAVIGGIASTVTAGLGAMFASKTMDSDRKGQSDAMQTVIEQILSAGVDKALSGTAKTQIGLDVIQKASGIQDQAKAIEWFENKMKPALAGGASFHAFGQAFSETITAEMNKSERAGYGSELEKSLSSLKDPMAQLGAATGQMVVYLADMAVKYMPALVDMVGIIVGSIPTIFKTAAGAGVGGIVGTIVGGIVGLVGGPVGAAGGAVIGATAGGAIASQYNPEISQIYEESLKNIDKLSQAPGIDKKYVSAMKDQAFLAYTTPDKADDKIIFRQILQVLEDIKSHAANQTQEMRVGNNKPPAN